MSASRLHRIRRTGDEGVALPMVLGTMFVLTAFLLTSLGLVINNMAPSRSDQDAKAALAAAQAGVDEYISRLNANSEYWAEGNGDPDNDAFTSDGVAIPGTGGQAASFRYTVLTDDATTAQQGFITLQVTGTSQPNGGGREMSRTLTARLQPSGFLDFIYYSDYETIDPSLLGYDPDDMNSCTRYHYEGRSDSLCPFINWTTGDVVDGPLHSNDALYVGGTPRFAEPQTESSWVKTSNPDKLWRGPGTPVLSGGATPGFYPRYAEAIDLPDANTELLRYVRPKTDSTTVPDTDAERPGCLYRGATTITFVGDQMEVLSPNTTDAPDRCLDTGDAEDEQTVDIPPVIHVAPTTDDCEDVGYPRNNEDDSNRKTTDYDPCRGTVFVEGEVDGQVTVSAEDDIVVTADLTVADDGATDVIGLVAGNYVWVYHPVKNGGANLLPYDEAVRDIEAAILSLRHSFVVQNWDVGARLSTGSDPNSKLRVFGAIAQKFRGPVGTGVTGAANPSTGYTKNYVYDWRFRVLQPPYFLAPEDAPWVAVRITDG